MRFNIISTISNVISRFGVKSADMLRAGNATAEMSWRHLCLERPTTGRNSRTDLLFGNVSTAIRKPAFYLAGLIAVTQQPTQEQTSGQMFQGLS